jgi:hypothetical protein
MMKTVSRYLPPGREFLPATGCRRTGRVVTFHQLPKSEWSCPNAYPTLPQHEGFNNYAWWKYGLSEDEVVQPDLATIGRMRTEAVNLMLPPSPGRWTLPEYSGASMIGVGVITGIIGLTYYLLKRKK